MVIRMKLNNISITSVIQEAEEILNFTNEPCNKTNQSNILRLQPCDNNDSNNMQTETQQQLE